MGSEDLDDWRPLGPGVVAWYDSPSSGFSTQLTQRIAATTGTLPAIRLRPTGLQVSLEPYDRELATAISAVASDLGLTADPSVLSAVHLEVATADEDRIRPFWRTVLGADHPKIRFTDLPEARPLRNRIHTDVVRPADAVEATRADLGVEPYGAYGVTISDPEGNEIDLVPGGHLGSGHDAADGSDTSDWRTVFSAIVHYPTGSAVESAALATSVVGLATDAGIPLHLDLGSDGVTVDSGKDAWESAPEQFAAVAGRVQAEARRRGHAADPRRPCFVQFGVDALDIPAVRGFWAATLGYRIDPREQVTDIVDPRGLGPVMIFQRLDPSELDRRRQRNRLRFALTVPHDTVAAHVDAAVGAGGRVLTARGDRHVVADPEGNEVVISSQS